MKTRVDATKDKIELLQEMQGMIHTLKMYAGRIQEHIDIMIKSDLESMEAEKKIIDEMSNLIQNNNDDTKTRASAGAKSNKK